MNQVNHPFNVPEIKIVDRESLQPKRLNFMESLFKLGKDKCIEYIGKDSLNKQDFTFCRYEIMTAASCVLLNKTNNMLGDFRDNVGLCRSEINLAKKNLNEKFDSFPNDKLEDYLRSLSLSTKSFC